MRYKAFTAILILAVIIMCSACSSKTESVAEPANNSESGKNETDSGKNETVTEVAAPELVKNETDGKVTVKIFVRTAGVTIFFSTDGISFQEYTGPIEVHDNVTVYAYAELDGVKSKTVGATFTDPSWTENGSANAGNVNSGSNGNGGNNGNTGTGSNNTGNNTNNTGNSASNRINITNGSLSKEDLKKARANYKPRFTVDLNGNFTDIDPTLFEKYYLGDQLVGRWYEDGWLNGYYLEIYGNGTWQFFGEETVGGTYEAVNNSFCLTENRFGRLFEAWSWTDPADGRTKLKLDGSVLLKSRANDTIEFYREAESKYCDDIEKYYIEKFPYRELAGRWYKVEGASEKYFYQFLETGNFQETINAAALEIGWIEDSGEGKGKYIGHEANSHQTISVEYPGDGYLYIKGIKYKKRTIDSDTAPDSMTGKWYYWDYDKNVITDKGIELFSDWTFKSLPDSPSSKQGTFIRLDDDYYPLFDDAGNYVTTLYQDMWTAAEKSSCDDRDHGREIDNQGIMYPETEKRAQDGDYSYDNESTDDDTPVSYGAKCFIVDEGGFFDIDKTMFGLSYDDFKDRLGRDDLMQPEAWPWWGHDMEVVYVEEDGETYACFFQYNRFVSVYRDAADEKPGNMFYLAVDFYGNPTGESTYWNGTKAYEWKLDNCYYQQHVETYSENDLHYRQQYISFDYDE